MATKRAPIAHTIAIHAATTKAPLSWTIFMHSDSVGGGVPCHFTDMNKVAVFVQSLKRGRPDFSCMTSALPGAYAA